jgi:hypothetical protein
MIASCPGVCLDPGRPAAPRGLVFRKPPSLHLLWATPIAGCGIPPEPRASAAQPAYIGRPGRASAPPAYIGRPGRASAPPAYIGRPARAHRFVVGVATTLIYAGKRHNDRGRSGVWWRGLVWRGW